MTGTASARACLAIVSRDIAPRLCSACQRRNSLCGFFAAPIAANMSGAANKPKVGFGDRQMKHWIHWLPGLDTARRYEAAWLPHDIFAGVVLATMLVPVGIAYAVASG